MIDNNITLKLYIYINMYITNTNNITTWCLNLQDELAKGWPPNPENIIYKNNLNNKKSSLT